MGKRTGKPSGPAPTALPSVQGAQFCDLVREGVPMREALVAAGIHWSQVSRWIARDPEGFGAEYAQAKRDAAAMWSERAFEILEAATPQSISVDRERAQYAKWRAGVQDRATYGDKQMIEQDTTLRVVVEYAQPDANRGALPPGGEG
jgi:hypothetical protein